MLDPHQGTAATHILKSQGQALSAGLNHTKAKQPLTIWTAKNSYCQQAWSTPTNGSYSHSEEPRTGTCQQAWYTPKHSSHSQTEEPRTGIVSRLETHQCIAVTHILESQEQVLSACLKHIKPQQPLTGWRAKNKHCQQAWNTPSYSSHWPPGEPRIGIVSRLETHQATAATHKLESQEQASSASLKHTNV